MTIDEVVTGARITAAAAGLSACPPFDGNGDQRARVDDLLVAIGNALDGCLGSYDPTEGAYDAQVDSSPFGPNGSGVASVRRGPRGDLFLDIQLDLLTYISVIGPVDEDLTATLNGVRVEDGDNAFEAMGTANLNVGAHTVEIVGSLLSGRPGEQPAMIAFTMVRPVRGTRHAYGGSYRLSFARRLSSLPPYDSFVLLPVRVPRSGIGRCGPAVETDAAGARLADLGEGTCIVSPSGGFRFQANRRPADGSGAEPLQLFGSLSSVPDVLGGGLFSVGFQPAVQDQGRWVAEKR